MQAIFCCSLEKHFKYSVITTELECTQTNTVLSISTLDLMFATSHRLNITVPTFCNILCEYVLVHMTSLYENYLCLKKSRATRVYRDDDLEAVDYQKAVWSQAMLFIDRVRTSFILVCSGTHILFCFVSAAPPGVTEKNEKTANEQKISTQKLVPTGKKVAV